MISKVMVAACLCLAPSHALEQEQITFSREYYECKKFASLFPNTCSDTNQFTTTIGFGDIPIEDYPCFNIEQSKCGVGKQMNGACVLQRQLCVQCYIEGLGAQQKTRIRVQTNSVPNHCY